MTIHILQEAQLILNIYFLDKMIILTEALKQLIIIQEVIVG